VRRWLGLKEGECDVLLEVRDNQPVVIAGRAQALKKAQAVLARYVAPGALISEERSTTGKPEMTPQRGQFLDASALLPALYGERGSEGVARIIDDCAIHAVNLAETVRKMLQTGA
jgi:hypothetical protein